MWYVLPVSAFTLPLTLFQYRGQDKPWFRLGHGMVLMYIVIGFIAATVLSIYLRRQNHRRALGLEDEVITGVNDDKADTHGKNGVFVSVEEAKRSKGDKWSGYKYTL